MSADKENKMGSSTSPQAKQSTSEEKNLYTSVKMTGEETDEELRQMADQMVAALKLPKNSKNTTTKD